MARRSPSWAWTTSSGPRATSGSGIRRGSGALHRHHGAGRARRGPRACAARQPDRSPQVAGAAGAAAALVLPLVFIGLIFRGSSNTKQGIVNDVPSCVGLAPRRWLSTQSWRRRRSASRSSGNLVRSWRWCCWPACRPIPRSLYEAAEIDGARRRQQFVEITLPMLRPAIVVALIFRTITADPDLRHSLRDDAAAARATPTETLAMYIHKTTIDFLDFGYGSALATLMFIVSMVRDVGLPAVHQPRPRR